LSANYEKAPAIGTGNITANTQSNVVIGTSTNFSNELIPTTTIYVDGDILGNVNVVSNTTTLSFTANALSNISVSAFTYSTNVFIINNFVSVTGTINANTNSNVVTGIVSNVTGSGTITGNVDSTTITGSGTAFNTQLAIGKNLYYSGNSIGIITSIRSANILTLSGVLASNLSNVSYTADGTTTLFARELYVGDTIVVNTNVILGTVRTINSNTNLVLYSNSLSTVSNVAFEHTARDPYTAPTTGDQYLKFPQVTILA
jgi:cytoskeletal protein CcmA (bactofilin family)